MLQVSGLCFHFQNLLELIHVMPVDILVLLAIICMCSHFHSEKRKQELKLVKPSPGNHHSGTSQEIAPSSSSVLFTYQEMSLCHRWVFICLCLGVLFGWVDLKHSQDLRYMVTNSTRIQLPCNCMVFSRVLPFL